MEELEVPDSFMRSKKKIKKDKRDLKIFFKYHKVMENKDAQAMTTKKSLAKENGLTLQTMYNICKEVPGKLPDLIKNHPEFQESYEHYLAH